VPSLLGDCAGEIEDDYARIVEEVVDGRVEARAATDFGQDGRGYADQARLSKAKRNTVAARAARALRSRG
jgi:hypothetical protein